ncbi:MAG: hypothetical protein V1676_00090 [Candidatus Diapherotrites archaeon]
MTVSENKDYEKEHLANGKQQIKEFPILRKYVDDFSMFSEREYGSNVFLNIAASAYREGNRSLSYNLLCEAEKVLTKFEIASRNKQTKENLRGRMKQFDNTETLSALSELTFQSNLLKSPIIRDVAYESSKGIKNDFEFSIESIKFNIELTGLGEGKPNKELKAGLQTIAKELLERIPKNAGLNLTVRTDLLRDSSKEMDRKHIMPLLQRDTAALWPIALIEYGGFHVEKFNDPKKNLFDYNEVFKYYSEFGARLSKLSASPEGLTFLKNTSAKKIDDNCIVSVAYFPAKHRIVEIQDEFVFPSITQTIIMEYLLGRLAELIKGKIEYGQLKGKHNPIICVHFNHTLFKGYTDNSLFNIRDYLGVLREMVHEVFKKTNEQSILGVLFWEHEFSKSIFFANPHARIKKPVLGKIRKVWQDATLIEKQFQQKDKPKSFDLKNAGILKTRKKKIEMKIRALVKNSVTRRFFKKRKFKQTTDAAVKFIKTWDKFNNKQRMVC